MQVAIFLLVALSALAALAQQYEYGVDIEALTRRQDGKRILVGRLPTRENGTVPHRLEIRQMRADPYKWDLFILAMSMFQYVSQDDPLSWYQVAGIHGVPFRSWNGVEPVAGGNQSGYCTHSSVLFPIWHRPYLALVEQEIYRMANFIANMFSNSTERRMYQRAASDIRFPYWDWSRPGPPGETHFPDVFWHPTIRQYGPQGFQTIRNPLYAYPFHPLEEDAMIWSPLRSWEETKRAPATDISLTSPPSNNDEVDKALLAKLPEIQQRLFILFSNYRDFNSFGNKAWGVSQNLSTWDSIEAVHDIIHIYGGLRGHMTYVPLSSFDPLFFFHHVSMDRLIAIWQVLNPSAWISPMAAGETSYTTVKGDIQNARTELTPFYITEDGTFWTSDMARETKTFGYTYADTDESLSGGEDLNEVLIRKITQWYGETGVIGLSNESDDSGDDSDSFNLKTTSKGPPVVDIIENGRYTEWIANVHVNTGALGGSFAVHFHIGDPQGSCQQWNTDASEIGSVAIFGMKMSMDSQTKISGTLPLTSALVKLLSQGLISNFSSSAVEPFLRSTLKFRVCDVEDAEIDPRLVDGLYIGVSSAEVTTPRSDAELPKWATPVSRLTIWS